MQKLECGLSELRGQGGTHFILERGIVAITAAIIQGIHRVGHAAADHAHKNGRAENAEIVIVYFVSISGVAALVRTGHGSKGDSRAVRENSTVPGHQNPFLPVDYARIINAEELCPLWQQQVVSCGRIKDVLGNLGNDVAGQIGIDACHHNAGNHRARFDFILLPCCA